jgi:hypothetical protein
MKERTIRRLVISLIVVAFGALALPLASSSQLTSGHAQNLSVTAELQNKLRADFVANHRDKKADKIKGPIRGTVHYGRYKAQVYAIAKFSIPWFGTTGQPEVFSRTLGGRWVDRGEGGGWVCSDKIPLPLLQAWKLRQSGEMGITGGSRTYPCFDD